MNKAILVFAAAGAVYAAGQSPDYFTYNGETYDIYAGPLEPFFKANDSLRPRGTYVSSGNIRGYTAWFSIKDSTFCVSEVKVKDYDEGGKTFVERSVFQRLFGQDTLKTAGWYSGVLVLSKGRPVEQEMYDDCFKFGPYYEYERYLLIDIAQGIIRSVQEMSNEEYRKYREMKFREYLESEEYKERMARLRKSEDSLQGGRDSAAWRFRSKSWFNKEDWGFSGYFGLNLIRYGDRTNAWIPDHGGPCFEVGVLYKTFSLNGEFRPWTVNGNGSMVIGADTIFDYWKFNDIKVNLVLTKDIALAKRISCEPFIGMSHTALVFLDEEAAHKRISIPSATGLLLGTFFNFKINPYFGTYYPFRIGIRYCIEDYSKVNAALGGNYWAVDMAFGVRGKFN